MVLAFTWRRSLIGKRNAFNGPLRFGRKLSVGLAIAVLSALGCPAAEPGDSTITPGPVIDSVEIRAENVFDLTHPQYDNFLFRLANKLHFVTRHSVIRRELLLGKGDLYDTSLVNESARNLRRLPYLLKTDIDLDRGENGENIMVVNTSDKWTTVGGASFHRAGGRNDLEIGIEEHNLFGHGITLANYYMVLENDRDYYQLEASYDRFLGYGFDLDVYYSDSPRAGQTFLQISRPFYTLQQRWGGEIEFSELRRRLDYYIAETLSAQERSLSDKVQLEISYRLGVDHLKYHFTPRYQRIELDSLGLKVYVPGVDSLLPPPTEDSLINYFQFTFRVEQIRYAVFERLNRFHKPEDINLGFDGRIIFGRALGADFKGFLYHYFMYWPQYTLAFGSNLAIIGVQHQQWINHHKNIRNDINCYFKWYSQLNHYNTFVFGVSYRSNRLENRSYTLYLDEDYGLRGYPAFFFNGENRLVVNVENRFFSDLEILSVGIGGVIFADIGNIWSRNSALLLADTQTAFGAGLRFGISRSTQGEVLRVDLAYAPRRESWQISVGTGQFF